MASVSWLYPQDQLVALRRQNVLAEAAGPIERGVTSGISIFVMRSRATTHPWRPLHAFDDGAKVYLEFPRGIGQGETPPLSIVGPEGKTSELVNYRVSRQPHALLGKHREYNV